MRHKVAGQSRSDQGHCKDDEKLGSCEHGLRADGLDDFVEDDSDDEEGNHHAPGQMVLRHLGRMTDVTRIVTAPGHESHTQRTQRNGSSRYGVPKWTNLRFSYGLLYLGQSESPGLLLAHSQSSDHAGSRHTSGFLCRMSRILIAILRSCETLIFIPIFVVWIYSIEHTRYHIGRCPILKSL